MTRPHHDELVTGLDLALDSERDEALPKPPAHFLVLQDRPTLLAVLGLDWAILVLSWIAMALGPRALYPLWALIAAGLLHALAVIRHDAAHMPRRRVGWLRPWLDLLAGYPACTTLDSMRAHHLRHHRHSGMAQDPYFLESYERGALGRLQSWALMLLLLPFWILRGWVGALSLLVPALRSGWPGWPMPTGSCMSTGTSARRTGGPRPSWPPRAIGAAACCCGSCSRRTASATTACTTCTLRWPRSIWEA